MLKQSLGARAHRPPPLVYDAHIPLEGCLLVLIVENVPGVPSSSGNFYKANMNPPWCKLLVLDHTCGVLLQCVRQQAHKKA